ncbi:MAG: IPTL-CTERM sorting domain-containing protein [Ottowia sp.]
MGNNWYLRSSPYVAPNVAPVPTLSHPGLLLTGGLLAGAAARARRRQKKA